MLDAFPVDRRSSAWNFTRIAHYLCQNTRRKVDNLLWPVDEFNFCCRVIPNILDAVLWIYQNLYAWNDSFSLRPKAYRLHRFSWKWIRRWGQMIIGQMIRTNDRWCVNMGFQIFFKVSLMTIAASKRYCVRMNQHTLFCDLYEEK